MSTLARSITLPQAVSLYLGAVVGSGVLILPGTAASIAGPASFVAWGADCLLGVPIALTFAALASRFPDPGGVSSFTRRAFGDTPGAVVGWYYLIASIVGQVIVTLVGGYYVAVAIGGGRTMAFSIAASILSVATLANLRGLTISARLQMAVSAGVVGLLVAAAALSVPRWEFANWSPFAPAGAPAIGRTAVLIFVAVFGWEAVAQLSAEFRNPGRDVVRATLVTVAIVTCLYLGISAATISTASYGSPELDRTAVSRLLGDALGAPASLGAALMALVISLGTCNAFVAASSRLAYALARDGSFPSRFGRLRDGIPLRAIAGFSTSVGLVMAGLYVVGADADVLLVVPSTLGLTTYVIGTASGVRLLRGFGRLMAAGSFVLTTALLPFAGVAIALPAGVGLGAWLYRAWRMGRHGLPIEDDHPDRDHS
jgi:amino acid efflux transporter